MALVDIFEVPKGPDDMNIKEEFRLKNFRHSEIVLSRSEKELLRKMGTLFLAHYDGTIRPSNEKWIHFVEVCKHHSLDPTTREERVWLKYLSKLEDEARLEKLYRAQLKTSPKRTEYLRSRFSQK